jgi:hypothetical protein
MDQVKIKVLNSQILESPHASSLDMLFSVIGIPKFAGNPKIFSFDNTFIDGLLDSITSFLFVSIVTGLINASVSGLGDGIVGAFGSLLFWNLPAAESDRWHFLAI